MAKRILIVDDDAILREIVGEFIQSDGFEVLFADNGVDGLQFLADDTGVGLVICDLKMPRMGGAEFVRTCSSLHPSIQIIILTGDPDACLGCIDAGKIFSLVSKPFDRVKLVELVRRGLDVETRTGSRYPEKDGHVSYQSTGCSPSDEVEAHSSVMQN